MITNVKLRRKFFEPKWVLENGVGIVVKFLLLHFLDYLELTSCHDVHEAHWLALREQDMASFKLLYFEESDDGLDFGLAYVSVNW